MPSSESGFLGRDGRYVEGVYLGDPVAWPAMLLSLPLPLAGGPRPDL